MKQVVSIALLSIVVCAYARDPFAALTHAAQSAWSVRSVVIGVQRSACISFNNQHYCVQEGCVIAGYTVAAISSNAVELVRDDERLVLSVMT